MKILGGGPDHRRPADIDVFNQFFESNAGLGCGFLESVEIHDHHVDGGNAVLGHGGNMFGIFAAMQDAAVNFGVQRLNTPIEHLGKSGEFRNIFDRDPGIAQQFGRASGGDEFDAEPSQLAGEIDQAGFIGDTQDGALDFCNAGHDGPSDSG